jgi:hypothetical protein
MTIGLITMMMTTTTTTVLKSHNVVGTGTRTTGTHGGSTGAIGLVGVERTSSGRGNLTTA